MGLPLSLASSLFFWSGLLGLSAAFLWTVLIDWHTQIRTIHHYLKPNALPPPWLVDFQPALLWGALSGLLGWIFFPKQILYLPVFWIFGLALYFYHQKTKRLRQKRAARAQFPLFLDLLAALLFNGFDFSSAWEKALSFLPDGPLKEEGETLLKQTQRGLSFEEALLRWEREKGNEPFSGAIALMRRALSRGGKIAQGLQSQSRALRYRDRLRFEEASQTLGIRLLIPIMLFIAPALFISIFAPLFYFVRTRGFLF